MPFPKKESQTELAADLEWKQLNNGGKGRRLVTRLRSLGSRRGRSFSIQRQAGPDRQRARYPDKIKV